MASGSQIIVSSNPKGVFLEGIISGTPKPGVMMEVLASTETVGGEFTYRVYTSGTDGAKKIVIVLLADDLQGKLVTDAYVTGTRGFLYCPAPGELLNMWLQDVSGTGDDHPIGELLIADSGTGQLLVTTGTPGSQPFTCMETVTDPTADTLALCMFNGA